MRVWPCARPGAAAAAELRPGPDAPGRRRRAAAGRAHHARVRARRLGRTGHRQRGEAAASPDVDLLTLVPQSERLGAAPAQRLVRRARGQQRDSVDTPAPAPAATHTTKITSEIAAQGPLTMRGGRQPGASLPWLAEAALA